MTEATLSHQEADLLLPWYANETLEKDEQECVQLHLKSCEECRENLELFRQLAAAVDDKATIPIVPQPRMDHLLERIDRVKSGPATSGHHQYWITAASIALLVIVAAMIGFSTFDRTTLTEQYRTLTTTGDVTAVGYVLEIEFSGSATNTERESVFQQIGARDVSFDSESNKYRLTVKLSAGSLDALDTFTTELSGHQAVNTVAVVAVQLPILDSQ